MGCCAEPANLADRLGALLPSKPGAAVPIVRYVLDDRLPLVHLCDTLAVGLRFAHVIAHILIGRPSAQIHPVWRGRGAMNLATTVRGRMRQEQTIERVAQFAQERTLAVTGDQERRTSEVHAVDQPLAQPWSAP